MTTTQSLSNIDGIKFDELSQLVAGGAKFVIYQYTISLGAVTLRRFSAAYYIPVGEHPAKFKGTANALSAIFGWWCLPWGPMRTIQSFKVNNKGGVDITKDVMANITAADFEKQQVVIETIYSPYRSPNKIETECFHKSLRRFMANYPEIESIYFAEYVNVENDTFFVIGLPGKYVLEWYENELTAILYKEFNKRARFEFIDIEGDDDAAVKLKELDLKVTRYANL